MGIEITGVGGLILLILNVWALVSIVTAPTGTGNKVIWVIVILLLPLLGFLIWLIFGPRSARG